MCGPWRFLDLVAVFAALCSTKENVRRACATVASSIVRGWPSHCRRHRARWNLLCRANAEHLAVGCECALELEAVRLNRVARPAMVMPPESMSRRGASGNTITLRRTPAGNDDLKPAQAIRFIAARPYLHGVMAVVVGSHSEYAPACFRLG